MPSLLVSDLGEYSSLLSSPVLIVPQSQLDQKTQNDPPEIWATCWFSDGSWHSWLCSHEHPHPPLGGSEKMQLEEGGKESSATIFSNSTDLHLLKLTAKPHLCYAKNKNCQMKSNCTKEKSRPGHLILSVQGRQTKTEILQNQKHQMAQRHIWVCFQSRTSNNTLQLDTVPIPAADLQAG